MGKNYFITLPDKELVLCTPNVSRNDVATLDCNWISWWIDEMYRWIDQLIKVMNRWNNIGIYIYIIILIK